MAGLRRDGVDHPGRDRHRGVRATRRAGGASRAPARPSARGLGRGSSAGSKVIARARCARSLPDAVRGSAPTGSIALGTLKPARRAAAVRAQLLGVRGAPSRSTTAATTASPHSRVGAAEDAGLGHRGMLLEHRLDLGGRDVLAAADDRVGLAAGDDQAAALVEARRGRPVCSVARRRRRRRAARRGSRRRRRSRRRCPAAGTGGLGVARVGTVTCEQASRQAVGLVRPARPAAPRARAARGGTAAPPISTARSRGGARRPASSRRWSVVGTSEASVCRSVRRARARRRSARGRPRWCA